MRVLIQVHHEKVVLVDPAVVQQVRDDIVAAARAGGSFVRIGPEGAPEMLITASTAVRIESLPESPDTETGSDSPDGEFVDLDSYAIELAA